MEVTDFHWKNWNPLCVCRQDLPRGFCLVCLYSVAVEKAEGETYTSPSPRFGLPRWKLHDSFAGSRDDFYIEGSICPGAHSLVRASSSTV